VAIAAHLPPAQGRSQQGPSGRPDHRAQRHGMPPPQLRSGGCCASGVVRVALAVAGRTPSRPNNWRRSIDDGIERRIPVLATWSAGTFEGCAITVDGIHNANTSNSVSVLSIGLPRSMRYARRRSPRVPSTVLRKPEPLSEVGRSKIDDSGPASTNRPMLTNH